MSVETVIRGGLIATVEATFRADIGIDQGRICAIAERVEGREVIDATGCVVVPGAIDVHTHFETGLGDSVTADDYESGSRAAAFGGVTTYVNYAFQDEGASLGQALDREAAKAAPKSYVDYSFHPVVTRVDAGVLAEFEAVRDAGFSSVKLFTAVPGFQLADDDVLAVLRRAAETGMLVNVHAEDGALIEHLTARLVAEGRFEMDALPEARPDLAEALATEKLAIYGELLGCPVYFVHLSSVAALEAVRRGRARGAELYVETRSLYLFHDERQYHLPGHEARKYVAWPPLRTAADSEALWAALARGEIQTCATDHTTWLLAQKTDPSLGFASIPGGVSNVETHPRDAVLRGRAQGPAQPQPACRRDFDEPGEAVRHVAAQGHDRRRRGCRLRDHRPRAPAAHHERADAVPLRLRPVRGARGGRLAGEDGGARAGRRRPGHARRRAGDGRADPARGLQPAVTPSPRRTISAPATSR